jgi:hypothetical protein
MGRTELAPDERSILEAHLAYVKKQEARGRLGRLGAPFPTALRGDFLAFLARAIPMLRQGVMLETTWALDTLGQERWHIRTAQTLRLIVNMPRLSTFQAISSRFAWFRKCRSGHIDVD